MKHWKRLYKTSDTFTCPYCLRVLPVSQATRDHAIPSARYGKTDEKNVVLVCAYDNHRKGMLTPDEYRLWELLNSVRNGDKDSVKQLEYIMYILENKHYKGRI